MDILTRENLSSIQLANMNLIYLSVRSSSWRGRDEVKAGHGGGIVVLASCEYHCRLHANLVQHPSNNISIVYIYKVE